MKCAVVLLSGGIDSTTTLAIAIAEGYEAYALSFDYGQRHEIEIGAARRVADSLGTKEHRIAKIDLRVFGGSALTADLEVPKNRASGEMRVGIPITYVPDRLCVESKSLKFYLGSYRNERAFNEAVTNHILDDFVKACAPREAVVTAQFSARGGIALTVRAAYPDEGV